MKTFSKCFSILEPKYLKRGGIKVLGENRRGGTGQLVSVNERDCTLKWKKQW